MNSEPQLQPQRPPKAISNNQLAVRRSIESTIHEVIATSTVLPCKQDRVLYFRVSSSLPLAIAY